jgi:exportin-2 (importin alpha re-exporter)
LLKLFRDPQALRRGENEDADAAFTAVDIEEQNAGYQAAYSRLAASEVVSVDPVAHISDPKAFLGQELSRVAREDPQVKSLISASDAETTGPFLQSLSAVGYTI